MKTPVNVSPASNIYTQEDVARMQLEIELEIERCCAETSMHAENISITARYKEYFLEVLKKRMKLISK